jgi:outer membrane biosynthesis protein TonB
MLTAVSGTSASSVRQALGLDANAADTVRKYRFTPATKDGKPVPVRIAMSVTFKAY